MNKYTVLENALNIEEVSFYQKFYPDHKVTCDLMQEERLDEDGNTCEMIRVIIVKGTWTPHGCARDCGDHYIIANYSSYDRLNKFFHTKKIYSIKKDVDDR